METAAEDAALRDALAALEPLYHAACPQATVADFDRLVAPGFWEIGASGRRYDRAFARQVLADGRVATGPDSWATEHFQLQRLGAGLALLSYRLAQFGRLTERSTLWQCREGRWQAVFHQGTVVAGA